MVAVGQSVDMQRHFVIKLDLNVTLIVSFDMQPP
jgi:hypothetical protein